jgi:hypothetical protein
LVNDITDKTEMEKRLADTKIYIGKNALFYSFFNQEDFNAREYDEKAIMKYADLHFTQFEVGVP